MTVEKQDTSTDKPLKSENKNIWTSLSTWELVNIWKWSSRVEKSTKKKYE